MRHAESQEDIDKTVYSHTTDLDIALSKNGEVQATNVSAKLLEMLSGDTVHFYISPGLRLRQTYEFVSVHFPKTLTHSFIHCGNSDS